MSVTERSRLRRKLTIFDWRTAERRDGYYIGTDQPHTDSDGTPLSPTNVSLWPGRFLNRVTGFAYFVQHEEGGPIKIGTSLDPEDRLRGLNLNTHDPRYRIIATVPGGQLAERNLHIQFRHIRIHGEWFLPDPELLDHIASLDA